MFEDSLSGIQAAASAGMVCVALSTTLPVSQLRGKAAIVVKDFNSPKLRKLLSRLVAKRKEAATASEKHGGRKRGKGKQQSSGRPPVAPAKKRLGKRLRRPVLNRLK